MRGRRETMDFCTTQILTRTKVLNLVAPQQNLKFKHAENSWESNRGFCFPTRCLTGLFGIKWWKIKLLWVRNLHKLFYLALCHRQRLKHKCKSTGAVKQHNAGNPKYICTGKRKEREISYWAEHSPHTTRWRLHSLRILFLEAVCRNGGGKRDTEKEQWKYKRYRIGFCSVSIGFFLFCFTEANYKTFINSVEQSCNMTMYFWKFDFKKKFNLETASRSPQSNNKENHPLFLLPVKNFSFLTSEEELMLWSK